MQDTIKNAIVAFIIAVVVAAGAGNFLYPKQQQGTPIPDENLGAIPGSDISGNYFSVGGVQMAFVSQKMIATSSVPCVVKNPFSAPASVIGVSANFSDTVTAATKVNISTSSSAVLKSTSSPAFVYNYSLPANATAFLSWEHNLNGTTTYGASNNGSNIFEPYRYKTGVNPFVIKSGEYIGLKVATSAPGVHDLYAGTCSFRFQKL